MSEDPTPYQHEAKLSAEQRRVLERADKFGLIYEGDDAICGGIHFCPDWDGMAVCADSPEADGCHCGRLRPKASTLSEDEVGAPAPCEVSHNDGKQLDTSKKSLGDIARSAFHKSGADIGTPQGWDIGFEAAAQAVRLHVLEEAAKVADEHARNLEKVVASAAETRDVQTMRQFEAIASEAKSIASSIRALKSSKDGGDNG